METYRNYRYRHLRTLQPDRWGDTGRSRRTPALFQTEKCDCKVRETVLPDSQIEQSNQIVINGTPLEEYLSGAQVVQTPCCSCACLTGKDEAECRAIDVGTDRYEAIPAELLKRVIIGIVESGEEACSSGCGCGTNPKYV